MLPRRFSAPLAARTIASVFDRIRPFVDQVAALMPPARVRMAVLRAAGLLMLVYSALVIGEFEFVDIPISAGLFDIGTRVVPFLLPALFGLRASLIIFIIFRLIAYPINVQLLLQSSFSDFYVTTVDRVYALGVVAYIFIAHVVDMQRQHEEEAVQQEIDSKLELVRSLHDRTARQLTHALMDLYMRNPSSPTTAILESAIQSLQEIVRDVRDMPPVDSGAPHGVGVMTQQRRIHKMVSEHADLTTTKDLSFQWHGIDESTIAPAIANELIFNAIKYSPTHQPIDLIFTCSGATQLLVVINRVGESKPIYSSGFGLESVKRDLRTLGGACITLLHDGKHYALMQWPVDALPQEVSASLHQHTR